MTLAKGDTVVKTKNAAGVPTENESNVEFTVRFVASDWDIEKGKSIQLAVLDVVK